MCCFYRGFYKLIELREYALSMKTMVSMLFFMSKKESISENNNIVKKNHFPRVFRAKMQFS
jgi:hypothetical protein